MLIFLSEISCDEYTSTVILNHLDDWSSIGSQENF